MASHQDFEAESLLLLHLKCNQRRKHIRSQCGVVAECAIAIQLCAPLLACRERRHVTCYSLPPAHYRTVANETNLHSQLPRLYWLEALENLCSR